MVKGKNMMVVTMVRRWRVGDIAWNRDGLGDIWVVEGCGKKLEFVLYFDGKCQASVPVNEPIGFVKIGEYKARKR